ncbi:hypothetical protein [Parvibaculum sp.]|uniref:hypothetical protein n=1 Tax=Parvibaculum sp. TaxID=2024848 RepID=UPI003BAC0206
MTREIRFQLIFEGKASPEDEMGRRMNVETEAILQPGAIEAQVAGGAATAKCNAVVENDDYGGFSETGEITFGGGSLFYASTGDGSLGETPDPAVQLGHVTFRVERGTGIFMGASGYIVSAFTVNEDARVRDSQSAVVFVG